MRTVLVFIMKLCKGFLRPVCAACLFVGLWSFAMPEEAKAEIIIEGLWCSPRPAKGATDEQRQCGVWFSIETSEPDRFVSASSSRVTASLPLSTGMTVTPGNKRARNTWVVLEGPSSSFPDGGALPLTLNFQKAGPITVEVKVRSQLFGHITYSGDGRTPATKVVINGVERGEVSYAIDDWAELNGVDLSGTMQWLKWPAGTPNQLLVIQERGGNQTEKAFFDASNLPGFPKLPGPGWSGYFDNGDLHLISPPLR
jgi:hypothetical protein